MLHQPHLMLRLPAGFRPSVNVNQLTLTSNWCDKHSTVENHSPNRTCINAEAEGISVQMTNLHTLNHTLHSLGFPRGKTNKGQQIVLKSLTN